MKPYVFIIYELMRFRDPAWYENSALVHKETADVRTTGLNVMFRATY